MGDRYKISIFSSPVKYKLQSGAFDKLLLMIGKFTIEKVARLS
jgi:hypothetical protein